MSTTENLASLETLSSTINNFSNATGVMKYGRIGNFGVIYGLMSWTGAGSGGALGVTLPAEWLIDTADSVGGTSDTHVGATQLGTGTFFKSGVVAKPISVLYGSSNLIRFSHDQGIVTGSEFASGDSLKFMALIPL